MAISHIRSLRSLQLAYCHSRRPFSTTSTRSNAGSAEAVSQVRRLLGEPSWSVRSLLPQNDVTAASAEITPEKLHHLLRLSALPPPKDKAEEERMLATLSSQLHFVKEIQNVDTEGIKPLQSIRDETIAGRKEAELGLAAMADALSQEEVIGKHHKRIRRRQDATQTTEHEAWDVLGGAEKKVGRYFVVEGGKD